MAIEEVTIQKYVEGITTINSALGRLDVLRLHLSDNKMALTIVNTIMDDLAKVCGVEYNKINYIPTKEDLEKRKQREELQRPTPMKIEIVEEEKPQVKRENKNKLDLMQLANNVLKQEKKQENKKVENVGIQYDESTGNMVYKFVNSSTLDFCMFNKNTNDMIMAFKRNGRIYKYKNVKIYMFDNLVNLDEANGSAGGYFQQNIANKWTKGNYEEITDTMLIG